ncbi:MAG: hypothetical protein V4548_08575 [Bacteroidota bacterium]
MNSQELLLKEIRKQITSATSIIDAISGILNISYDASHRRISGKSKFSIEETIALGNHYKISLDGLFLQKDKIVVEKTIEISSLNDLFLYFQKTATNFELLTKNPNTTLFYSAKDIPLFYFMEGTILSKFKAYVWINLLNSETNQSSFEDFVITESFLESMQKLKKVYEKVNVKEIWNDTTINSSLLQILYFYESGLLTFKNAVALCNDLKRILRIIKEKSNKPESNYGIYYNEIILLNNNVLIQADKKLTLMVPYTLLGYFITENDSACNNVFQFFKQQINVSKALNHSGIKEQNLFFNKANRKIDYYLEQLKNEVNLDF